MSDAATLIGIIVGGSFLGYYFLSDKSITDVLPYLGAGAFAGGVVVPSIKDKKITSNTNSAILGVVGGGVAYFLISGMNDNRDGINVRRRVASHSD